MVNTETAARQAGAALAFQMLREIEARALKDMAYDAAYRDGRPQRNVVAAYFAKLRDPQDTRCETAFAAILTDYLAAAVH